MARPKSVKDLLALSDNDLARCGIGLVNLICGLGLRGSEELDVDACLAKIEEWTREIRRETERNLRMFKPRKAHDTIGNVKCWTIWKTIRHRKGLRHHLELENADPKTPYLMRGVDKPGPESSFYSAAPVFIHGLLDKRGTESCTSFPVLCTAIGRRLDYPMNIVLTVAHMYTRWDDPADRFNMDGGPNYINSHPDGYYIDKPVPWTHAERTCGNWFRSLSAREELGMFAGLRGCCLEANDRLEEAAEMFAVACRLLPKCPLHPQLLRRVEYVLAHRQFATGLGGLSDVPLSSASGTFFNQLCGGAPHDRTFIGIWLP